MSKIRKVQQKQGKLITYTQPAQWSVNLCLRVRVHVCAHVHNSWVQILMVKA